MDTIRQGEQFKKLFNLPSPWEAFEDITAKFYSLKSGKSITFKKSDGTITSEKEAYPDSNIIGIFFKESDTQSMTPGAWHVEFKLDYVGSDTPIWKPMFRIFNVDTTKIT